MPKTATDGQMGSAEHSGDWLRRRIRGSWVISGSRLRNLQSHRMNCEASDSVLGVIESKASGVLLLYIQWQTWVLFKRIKARDHCGYCA